MGKQGGDLKWWGSTSSTVLLDPAAFVESWKREIQGKDGIPAEHQRLIFAYRVATQEGVSYTCKRSSRCSRAKERAASDFLRELRSWKALLKSNNHVIAKLLRPLVAAEDEEIASHLYCETAGELRDIGIPCNVYYLFFDKWLLAAPREGDKCCKISSNINIQIDKDFQSKRFEILLFGRLNGSNLPVPFVYRMNGGEVAAQMSMHDQTAKYRQGHQMRRLGLSTQSVEKGVEGRDLTTAVEIGRSLNGFHGSEHDDNQYIRCGKHVLAYQTARPSMRATAHVIIGLELTAIVTKDPPRQFKYIVLTVIQVPPVGAPRGLEPATPHIPTVQQVSEWRRGGGKTGLHPDTNGFSFSSCTTTAHNCDMYSHDNHTTVAESPPATSCLDEHLTTSASDNEHNVSLTSGAPIPSQDSSTEHTVGEGNVEDMGSELVEVRADSLPKVDEPAGKNAKKKKKKRKGRRSSRSTADGNSVTIPGAESLLATAGVKSASEPHTIVSEGVKVQSLSHDISEDSREKRPLDQQLSQNAKDIKETHRQECVPGRQGEPGEAPPQLAPNTRSADGFDLGNFLEAVEDGLDALTAQCPDSSLEGASKQVGKNFRNESRERLDMIFDATDIEGKQGAQAEYISATDKDVWCLTRPSTECGMSGDFRDPCALNASPDRTYMSTTNGLSQILSTSQLSEHVIDVIDFVSIDGVLQVPDNSVCGIGGSHLPLKELAGNLEGLGDPKEQFNHSDTKVSARGGYNSGGTGRSGRGGAEGSNNRGYGRGSDERRGTSGYHGGSGQGSSGSSQGTGPGSSGTSGSGGGGGGSGGGNGNRGGGGGSSGGGWDGRPAENDSGNGNKEGESDERHRHSFQAGNNGEITSDSLQRKKVTSSLDSRVAKKLTVGMGEQVANGIGSNLATTSGGGKENNHTFWQKVQKSVEVEEVAEPEQLGEVFGSLGDHRRTASDEVNNISQADSRARPLSIHANGNLSQESPHDKEPNVDSDSSELGMMTQDLPSKIGKLSNSEWLLDNAELSNSGGSRRVKDALGSASTHGPDASKGAWQKKISWDEQRQNSQKNVSENPQHAGSSKGQLPVKQLNVRSARNGTYARGQIPYQQMISHTRSYSAPSTPHVFEESYSDAGQLNNQKSVKHMQGVTHQLTGPGTAGQIEQVAAQISLRPHTSYSSSASQLGEARAGPDEIAQRLTSWRGRKLTGEQERSVPREKIVGDRERTGHCAQKWVPVEHKSGVIVKGSGAQVKTTTSVPAAVVVTTSSRDSKENNGELANCKQSVISEEGGLDGFPCSVSPPKAFRRLQTSLGGSKSSGSVEQVSGLRESAVTGESPSVHPEQASLRSLLPREKVAETPAAVPLSETGAHHMSVTHKPEITKVSVPGERKGFVKRETGRRDVTGATCVRPEPYPAETETRSAVREVLDAVYASCRDRRASERVVGILGSPLAEFEKVLAAVAPSFTPVSDPNCLRRGVVEGGGPCVSFDNVLRAKEACFPEACEDNTTESRCRYSNTPISSLWQWYEEPSYYGVEVRNLDSHRGLRDGGEQEQFLAYFVPYLSGLQLFGYPSRSESISRNSSACAGTSVKTDVSPNCHPRPFPGNDVLAKLFPAPGRADGLTHHQRPEGSISELVDGPCNDMCTKDARNLDTRLLFEFFDGDQPQVRQPLFPKVKDLSKGISSLNSHSIGDPACLDNLCLGELHPASWFAVAWYPIYRIPEGPLRAVFLTYHSFNHTSKTSSSCPMGGGCEDMDQNSVSVPVVGLECYNLQAEPWLSLRSHCKEAQSMDRLPIGNVAQCLNDRIRSLKEVSELMAKGIPHDVASRSTEGSRSGSSSSSNSSSGSVSKFKHCDYEFFLKRRR